MKSKLTPPKTPDPTEDQFLAAAVAVFQNQHEFENKHFRFDSVNEVSERLQVLHKRKHISSAWIITVADAFANDYPIYIGLNNDWIWNFLTIKDPAKTREDIINQLAGADMSKAKFVNKEGEVIQ